MRCHVVSVAEVSADERLQSIEAGLGLIRSVWPRWLMEADATHLHHGPTDWGALFTHWPHLQLLMQDGGGRLVGVANSIPLYWDGPSSSLPQEGWDWAYARGFSDHAACHAPCTLSALAVTLAPSVRGLGLSRQLIEGLKDCAQAAGLRRLIAPVRPTQKEQHPWLSMGSYLQQRTADGLPLDPWLRTHVRMNARLIGPCERSMKLSGPISHWERWLSVKLTLTERQAVPTLLAPLRVDHASGVAFYTEPNVWVEHPL